GVPAATRFIEYRYANGAYSETASCSCKKDLDYAKVSQFDAVDNARSTVERNGFSLQIATFDDTPELGKELRYEARKDTGDVTLVGRNFFQRCSRRSRRPPLPTPIWRKRASSSPRSPAARWRQQ